MAVKLAIFASGAGSNARKIIEYFRNSPQIDVSLIVCNHPGAGVMEIAHSNGIQTLLIERQRFMKADAYLPVLNEHLIDFIVLAGFLWKVPKSLIVAYPQKIINIHPALLPKYGGKGMYGHFVHEAVIASGEKESGITIHYVDPLYDHGDIIFQATCPVEPGDNADSLAQKIHLLEHRHFAPVIEQVLQPIITK